MPFATQWHYRNYNWISVFVFHPLYWAGHTGQNKPSRGFACITFSLILLPSHLLPYFLNKSLAEEGLPECVKGLIHSSFTAI